VGKAILAAGAANRSATADVTITPMTPRSLTSHRDLAADLARTRCRGYAVDDEEHALGLRCVAAPVLDVDGAPLCAISISGPTLRMDAARVEAMGADVRRVAGLVTREVGGAQNRSGNSR
jgi:IclR family acetate operon transcriptional repressor